MLIDFLPCFDILEVDLFEIEYGGSDMKIVQVVPKSGIDSKLKTLLKNFVNLIDTVTLKVLRFKQSVCGERRRLDLLFF